MKKSKIIITLIIAVLIVSSYQFGDIFFDSEFYLTSAKFYQGKAQFSELKAPFSYRPLPPFLVAASPLPIDIGFGVLNILFMFGAALLMYELLKELKFSQASSLIGALMLVVSFPAWWYGSAVLTDAAAMFFIALGLLLIYRKENPWLITGVICLGTLAREVVGALLIVAVLMKIYNKKTIFLAALPPLTILGVRHIFSSGAGFIWPIHSYGNLVRPHTYLCMALSLLPFIFVFFAKPTRKRFLAIAGLSLLLITITGFTIAWFDGRFIWPLYYVLIPLNLSGISRVAPHIYKKITTSINTVMR